MTAPTQAPVPVDDAALKARLRAMWSLGDYPRVAHDVIPTLGATLVDACGIREGQRVLDVAAGAGNASIPAAAAGARVVASDLSPALLDAGRRASAERGVELEWQEADVEDLPYDADSFDAVLSCVGVMFAPHHQRSADEIVRVCRPGGTIGLASWTPEGFVGQMLRTMSPYAPPPPPGAQPPPLWGSPEHVLGLLGDRVTDVDTERRTVRVDRFATGAEFRDFFKANYGPTVAVYRAIAEDPARVAGLDAALADLAEAHGVVQEAHGTADGGATTRTLVMEWEYLLLTARKRA